MSVISITKYVSKGKEISEQAKDMLLDIAINSGNVNEDKLKEFYKTAIQQRINIEKNAINNRDKKRKSLD